MGFILIGLLLIFICIVSNKSIYDLPKWVNTKYICPIHQCIYNFNSDVKSLIGVIGAFILSFSLIIMLISNWENKQLVAQFNYNPCSMYRINDEIAEHRAFENDIFFNIFYSSDVADLPHIECRNHKIYKQIPRGGK